MKIKANNSLRQRLSAAYEKRFGVLPTDKSIPGLLSSQRSVLLQEILKQEQEIIDEQINCLFGYHLLEGSVFDVPDLSQASTINHRFRMTPCQQNDPRKNACVTEFDSLPLHPETIDVAVLHHMLDFSPRPHHVLKAVAQAVVYHGHMVIVGFNPLSFLGLEKITAQMMTQHPLSRRYGLRQGRLLDWLHLLDFEPISIQQGFYSLPINSRWMLDKSAAWERVARRWDLPCGGFYVILARKNVCAMTPLKSRWDAFNPVLGIIPSKTTSPISKPLQPGMSKQTPETTKH